ncbi:MAG: hypothetical protein FWD65_04400 [Coriobacteriia bacterium]|nr:hypothetical protein [Coriobacteriia bacterium]
MSATKQLLEAIQATQKEVQASIDLCDGLAEAIAMGTESWDAFLAMVEAGTPAARARCEIELAALESDAAQMTAAELAEWHPATAQRAAAMEADMREEAGKVAAVAALAKAA